MNNSKKTGRSIGVDLGTTNSCVAYINDANQPEVILSREGGRTIPSVFAVTKTGQKIVGKTAIDQEGVNPEQTIRSIKRKMGSSDRITIAGTDYSPEEISSEILKKIKADAEAFFGESVTDAVITVPAYFDGHKRKCTKIAGELAGLNVLRVINEPTAAALAYGMDRKKNEAVLVFDLGGGTFDITILQITDDGVFEVISTAGDDELGGDDFDDAITSLIIAKANLADWDTPSQKARLRDAAEKAKFQLSASDTAQVVIPYFAIKDGLPVNVECEITLEEFEGQIGDLIERMRKCLVQAFEDAKMSPSDIHEVVFVGGSTRVPIIAQKVKLWTGKIPNRSVNPDEAVALGASVQAAILSGEHKRDVLLLDVIPLSLGIETDGGVMTVMMSRNSPIPNSVKNTFTNAEDGQVKAVVKVFQGERPIAVTNRLLGEFHIGICPAPAGTSQIEITYAVDANGILMVTAKDKLTGVAQNVEITGESSLSSDEIARILADAAVNAESDQLFRELSDMKALLKDRLTSVDVLLRDAGEIISDEVKLDLQDLRASLSDAIEHDDLVIMQGLVESADESLEIAQKMVSDFAEELISAPEECGEITAEPI